MSDVRYRYRVSAVPNAEYKAEGGVVSNGAFIGPSRTVVNHHGVRIVVSFSGNVGWPDAQTTLINLTVSLGLLSVAVIVMDIITLWLCPLRNVYAQYKERVTVECVRLDCAVVARGGGGRAARARGATRRNCGAARAPTLALRANNAARTNNHRRRWSCARAPHAPTTRAPTTTTPLPAASPTCASTAART